MIDIIIPCYNSHDTIDRCLGSILCQRITPSLHITLVNDGGKSYKNVIKRYPTLDIQEIKYDKNGGPAKARNFGILNTTHDYIMFMDSDDVLANPFATLNLINDIIGYDIVSSCFIEEIQPMVFKTHKKDVSFMHGKIYSRKFLMDNNILQNEQTKCNEDVGFNILAMLLTDKIKFVDYNTYYWLYNTNSIVRKDKTLYNGHISFVGFVENLIYVFKQIEERNINNARIVAEKITSMQRIIKMYNDKSAYKDSNINIVKQFYNEIYKPIEDIVTDDIFTEINKSIFPENNVTELKDFIKTL